MTRPDVLIALGDWLRDLLDLRLQSV